MLKPLAAQFGKMVMAAKKSSYEAYAAALGPWNEESARGMYELLKTGRPEDASRALRCLLYTQASVFPPPSPATALASKNS